MRISTASKATSATPATGTGRLASPSLQARSKPSGTQSRARSSPTSTIVEPSKAIAFCRRRRTAASADARKTSIRPHVVHDLAADHGHERLDQLDLARRHREVVAVEHQKVGIAAGRKRADI